jgi:hypothetical protein
VEILGVGVLVRFQSHLLPVLLEVPHRMLGRTGVAALATEVGSKVLLPHQAQCRTLA